MDIFDFSWKIDDMDRSDDIPFNYEIEAQRNGFVILYAKDGIIYVRGAIVEEISFKNGTEYDVWFSERGVIYSDEEFDLITSGKIKVKVKKGIDPVWDFSSEDIEYSMFDIYDGMDQYCRGIVFSIDEIG
jgi:hypothetical protein